MCVRTSITQWNCGHSILEEDDLGSTRAEFWDTCAAWRAGNCQGTEERSMAIPWPCPHCQDEAESAIMRTHTEFSRACQNIRDAIDTVEIAQQFGRGTSGKSTFVEMVDDRGLEMHRCAENFLPLLRYQRRMVILHFFTQYLPLPEEGNEGANEAEIVAGEPENNPDQEDIAANDEAWGDDEQV